MSFDLNYCTQQIVGMTMNDATSMDFMSYGPGIGNGIVNTPTQLLTPSAVMTPSILNNEIGKLVKKTNAAVLRFPYPG